MIPTIEMSLASYIAHLRSVVKAIVTLLMLSLLSSPCPRNMVGAKPRIGWIWMNLHHKTQSLKS